MLELFFVIFLKGQMIEYCATQCYGNKLVLSKAESGLQKTNFVITNHTHRAYYMPDAIQSTLHLFSPPYKSKTVITPHQLRYMCLFPMLL